MIDAIRANDVDQARSLLASGECKVEEILIKKTRARAIHLASSTAMLAMLIDEFFADINSRSFDGSTALIYAAMEGDDRAELIQLLCERRCDVDAVDDDGDSALYYASTCHDGTNATPRCGDNAIRILKSFSAQYRTSSGTLMGFNAPMPRRKHFPLDFSTMSTDNEIVHTSSWISQASPPSPARSDNVMICLNSDVMEKEITAIATQGIWSTSTFASFYCADGASNRVYDGLCATPALLEACRPDYIVGDLDSIRRDVENYYESVGTQIVKNPDQDTNDFEKCVEHLLSQNASIESNGLSMNEVTLVVMGAFGGRFDQQMYSLHVCYKYIDTFKSINLVGDGNCAYLLKGGLDTTHYINLQQSIEGPGCSLLPIGTPIRSLFTTGLKWNLDGQSMGYGQLVSSSNCVEAESNGRKDKGQVSVRTEDTLLFCFDLDLQKTTIAALGSRIKESRIRMAMVEDLDAIMQIIGEVVPLMNAAGNFQWDEKYPTREAFSNDITNQVLYVAELRDSPSAAYQVVGVAALTEDQSPEYADCGWDLTIPSIVTHRLAVSPSARRQGIALKLFYHADVLARERGYDRVRVDTNKLNTSMQNVMLKAGYVYAGEISLNSKPKDMRFLCFEKMM